MELAELRKASWEELEVVQHETGRLMFPAELRRRKADGTVEAVPVRVWVPVTGDYVEARKTARLWFAKLQGLDAERDKALFEEMDGVCVLARAIRNPQAPYAQFAQYDELAEKYDQSSLRDIQERIKVFESLVDPRMSIPDEDTMWRVIAEVARKGTLLPLADIVGHEQPSLVLRMALEACRSTTAPSFVRSIVTSTPDSSPSRS